ncbi:hypothetical protein C0995_013646 [Termitomyces sp. Mi166|nr:hypothetical protein C0995_013646 [Termitomyces sp. Mi166\
MVYQRFTFTAVYRVVTNLRCVFEAHSIQRGFYDFIGYYQTMTSSDKYSFADKLRENVIPDDVLEARNVRRSILPETQQTLPALEKEAQADIARHDHEGEQAQIALAPYERLPEDLLLKIFLYLSEEVSLPPVFTQFPWILGRVCSYWRSISRNDSRLWGCLAFKLPSQSNYLPILPPGARISIEYASDSNFDLLLPVLNRCKILK